MGATAELDNLVTTEFDIEMIDPSVSAACEDNEPQ